MAKFYGVIGFIEMVETAPGIYVEQLVERSYYGELVRNSRRLQSADQVNDEIVVTNEISILADPYANQNFHSIRYAEFMGTKWKVTNAEVLYPRIKLSMGGVYNGQ